MDPNSFCRGSILGGLIGDCYGYVFEDRPTVPVNLPVKLITDTINGVEKKQLIYTDDTQMGLALLRSLRNKGKYVPEDVAAEFTHDYFSDGSHRYYGGNIGAVFRGLQSSHYKEPYKYGAAQFNGSGSFGNGGAMRISPLAVYALKLPTSEFEQLVIDSTRITHTHPLAICGALLQAFAVRHVWEAVSKSGSKPALNKNNFLDALLKDLLGVSNNFVNFKMALWKDAYNKYAEKFEHAKKLLADTTSPTPSTIVRSLGNDLKALNSVPTAIFAFLRSLEPIPGIKFTSIPLRCLTYVISLGGDTDSIGTMACSLAGGYVGLTAGSDVIPAAILARCERVDTLEDYANWLADRLTV